jgi:hypothetical protein
MSTPPVVAVNTTLEPCGPVGPVGPVVEGGLGPHGFLHFGLQLELDFFTSHLLLPPFLHFTANNTMARISKMMIKTSKMPMYIAATSPVVGSALGLLLLHLTLLTTADTTADNTPPSSHPTTTRCHPRGSNPTTTFLSIRIQPNKPSRTTALADS